MVPKFSKKDVVNFNEETLYKEYESYIDKNKDYLFKIFNSKDMGLTNKEAIKRREEYGKNIINEEKKKSIFTFLIDSFKDPFIYILIILATINFLLGDKLGSLIIVMLALTSSIIRLIQDYSAYKFDVKLKSKIYTVTTVIRQGIVKEIPTKDIVVGDIIELNAGSIIPSDAILLESKDLFVNQGVFTGESVPVEKKISKNGKSLLSMERILLMNTSVVTGRGKALVIKTGKDTYLGNISKSTLKNKTLTNFEIGMNAISKTLIQYMLVITVLVFILNALIHHNILEAFFFAVSVAVGITPSMLPMIVNVNLSKGAKSLAKKDTLVKRSEAIENLGAIDVLCTDKTGTLTKGEIILTLSLDSEFKDSIDVLKYAYINSIYSTGIKNIVDKAIITYAKKRNIEIDKYEKVDEIPFDYERRKASIIIKDSNDYRMIIKGALIEVIDSCDSIYLNKEIIKLNKKIRDDILTKARELSKKGMQVIALASKKYTDNNITDDKGLVFLGVVAFEDPIKPGVKNTINNLKRVGITTKILTGDNVEATQNICSLADIPNDKVVTGEEFSKLSLAEQKKMVEEVSVFARLTPLEKDNIIKLLKENGHVVGYMGDGVNDAPSLIRADVGISVNTATSIAKEASDIILLKKSLKVVYEGVLEGRKVYGNIMKYMKMALSAAFGDVFSVFLASIFLPFLPMLPIQFLLQDLLYDMSQTMIPFDDVDKEFLIVPHKWDTSDLRRFMNIMGVVASSIDIVAFIGFYYLLGFNANHAVMFQTAWFIEGVISQTLIVHFVRTAKIPFIESTANKYLLISTFLCIIASMILPILLAPIKSFHFTYLPLNFYIFVIFLSLLYIVVEEIVKKMYIKKYKRWL